MNGATVTQWLGSLSQHAVFSDAWYRDATSPLDELNQQLTSREVTYDDLRRWSIHGAPNDVSDAIRALSDG